MALIERKTVFSPCRAYRYTLWREWDFPPVQKDLIAQGFDGFKQLKSSDEYLMVIGLNPSTADEQIDDPTIRRCVGFAKAWGFGALCMTNLFALRAPDPKVMMADKSPIGGENDRWLLECASGSGMTLAAWGNHGAYLDRDAQVLRLLRGQMIHCLRKTKQGMPEHPLYIPASTEPIQL